MSKPIFISHASVDRAIADKVVDLLNTAMGIDVQNAVFCSSLEGMKIPGGMDFKEFIKKQIQEPQIVLLLISQNYLASAFCLAEAGASWAMSHRIIPFLIPPAKVDDMKAVLAGIHALCIEDPGDWNEALGTFREILKIDPNVNRWERKRDEKIEEMRTLIAKQPRPPILPFRNFEELQIRLEGANAEISELERKNSELERLLVNVKELKDAREVATVELKCLPAAEAFEALAEKAKEALGQFNKEVREMFYYAFIDRDSPAPRAGMSDTEDRLADIRRAVEDGYLVEDTDGDISLNTDDPAIRDAIQALGEFGEFVEDHPELAQPYEIENRHQFDFSLRRFWQTNLSL